MPSLWRRDALGCVPAVPQTCDAPTGQCLRAAAAWATRMAFGPDLRPCFPFFSTVYRNPKGQMMSP